MVRGRLAWLAVVAAIAGCTLLTGVGDLDPSLANGIDPGDSSTSSEGGNVEGGGNPDGTANDASQPDTSTRLKDITFENGAIVHPQTGGDSVTSDAGGLALLTKDANVDEAGDATTLTAIGGDFSLQANGSAFLEENFGALDEIYVTARVRVDAVPATAVTVLRVVPETGTVTIDIRLLPSLRLAVFLGAQIGQNSNPLVLGKVHRIGIYVKKGKNSNGTLQVRLADDAVAFPTPFAQSSNIDFERPEKLQMGLPNPATTITFDDVKIDQAELPPL